MADTTKLRRGQRVLWQVENSYKTIVEEGTIIGFSGTGTNLMVKLRYRWLFKIWIPQYRIVGPIQADINW